MSIELTVVVATYNRAGLLRQTLAGLAAQRFPGALSWEILVVDNNSRDATPQVVASAAAGSAVPVHYVFEPRQGLSHARNRGIREARGAILAFTDDDILPSEDWVASIPSALARWNALGVGGRILPRWEAEPPRWLTDNPSLLGHLAIMDHAAGQLLALPLGKPPQVWGANMAFRRELFERAGQFDPKRGMKGSKLYRGEEADLIRRALERGLRIAYDPALTVFHRIGADRLRKSYFRRLIFDDGESRAARLVAPPADRKFLGTPLWLYRRLIVHLARWMRLAFLRKPKAFNQEVRCFFLLGRISGYRKNASRRAFSQGS